MNRWAGVAVIVGVIVAALHFTRPAPQSQPFGESMADVYPGIPPSPAVLGAGRYPPPTATVPPTLIPIDELIADQEAVSAARVDLGRYVFQTEPTTFRT